MKIGELAAKARVRELQSLEHQLVALRRTCDGAGTHACAILESFGVTADA